MQPYYQSCHQWQFDLCTYCCRIQFSTYMSWQILKGQKRCLKRLGKAGVHSWSWLIYGFLIHHCDSMILWRSNISVISSFFLISLFSAHDSQLQHVNSQHSSYKHTNKHNIQRFYSNTPPHPHQTTEPWSCSVWLSCVWTLWRTLWDDHWKIMTRSKRQDISQKRHIKNFFMVE